MKKYGILLILFIILCCVGTPAVAADEIETTETPTAPPTTIVTTAPTTVPPTTMPPTTIVTTIPTTPPTTAPPTTIETTIPPTTVPPTTIVTTAPPTTAPPTTIETTIPPTTAPPTIIETTAAPTTQQTTAEPTAQPTAEPTIPPTAAPTDEEFQSKPIADAGGKIPSAQSLVEDAAGKLKPQTPTPTPVPKDTTPPLPTENPVVPVSVSTGTTTAATTEPTTTAPTETTTTATTTTEPTETTTTATTTEPTETTTTATTTTPQYLTGGPTEAYPISGDAREVYPGDTAFVYEKIRINIAPGQYATSIAYMSGSASPSALNTIPADANGIINLLDVSVGGYTGSYRIYDGGNWTGSYIYIWQPDLTLRGELAGSTDSIDGQAVSKSSSIHYLIDSPKVGPSGIGAKANILITTPVGGQTTMLGYVNLANLDINSVRITTPDISLADPTLIGGTYTARAEWTVPQAFANYAKKSNTVTFYLGSSTGITITASTESVVRSNPFTVTVSGLPNTPYYISLDAGKSPVPELIPGQPGVVRGSENPTVTMGGTAKPALIPDGASSDPNSWGIVTTDASGKRVVQYSTNPVDNKPVEEGTYTIRINNVVDYGQSVGKGSDYDRVNVKVTKGGMTISATSGTGSGSYYLGEEVKLTGTNTDSDTTYLFLTGPNLNSNGVKLDSPSTQGSTKVPVKSDHTWEYRWDTSQTGLDAGSYTVYAVSTMNDKSHLSSTQYATYSIQLKQPSLSTGTSTVAAAKGDTVHIKGTVTGSPSSVAIFIFGPNYYERKTVSIDNGMYDYKMNIPESMSTGEYFVVVEHPMYDGRFGVQEIHQDGKTILAMVAPNGGTQSSFVVEGPGRLQGSAAANALVKMLDSPYIDDLYTTLKLTVQAPYVTISPIGNQFVGDSFVISGRTNVAPGDKLLVEVSPSSFVPAGKNQQTPATGVSGSVVVAKGSPDNVWSFAVDGSRLTVDSYTAKVSGVEVTVSASQVFDVVQRPIETPTPLPTTTAPPTTVPTPEPTESASAAVWFAGLLGAGVVVMRTLRR
ncbi:hypothetical protein [Methanorbis rubei]|uniref:DUF3821 domain-containing protein n=1 Tax=Methanorbis rubei TaxID=3028300 RepID=A0AAE4SBL1_9EURY|nr:hypothetical protein [Methanocorpusculaceae archaeon Cs1]